MLKNNAGGLSDFSSKRSQLLLIKYHKQALFYFKPCEVDEFDALCQILGN